MHILAKTAILLALLAGQQAFAQHYLEARGASTKYRYFDWNYTFSNSMIVDAFYIGVPDSNELNLGGGYGFKPTKSLTLAPMAYAVIGKETGQRGCKGALLVMFENNGWKANAFVGHYERVSGDVGDYQVLDTMDISRVVHGRVEIGFSSGFFHAGGSWNPQNGPLFKFNDRLGSWYASMRFGPQNELRFARTFLFPK
jgi:hypothetical protein